MGCDAFVAPPPINTRLGVERFTVRLFLLLHLLVVFVTVYRYSCLHSTGERIFSTICDGK